MKKNITLSLVTLLMVAACDSQDQAEPESPKQVTENTAVRTTIQPTGSTAPDLPDNAPAVGTAIKDVVKPVDADIGDTDVSKIMWEDLIPQGYEPSVIMKKYQKTIDDTPEGSPEEKVLFDKIMSEFNNAPANDTLAGKKVKIPGFVSPLDENNGMVGDFLLVPYFGSCIHSPPPPVNQTVLVQPKAGKSIPMERIYEPVWVTGHMKVELQNTDLAQAGYLIEEAQLEMYKPEEENDTP